MRRAIPPGLELDIRLHALRQAFPMPAQALRLGAGAATVARMVKHRDPIEALWNDGVAAWREVVGLTQVELAERLEVSRRTVQYWEATPARKVPRVVRLALVASGLPHLPKK